MSHLRMLLASLAAVLAVTVTGSLFIGAAPALADGPHMMPPMNQPMHNFDHDRDRDRFHIQPVFPIVRPVFPIVRPVVYQPVVYQPVVYPVPTPSYPVSPCMSASYGNSYFWMSYGPSWNYGCTSAQLAQICQVYNQAVMANPAAYNASVQTVCNTLYGNGYQYSTGYSSGPIIVSPGPYGP